MILFHSIAQSSFTQANPAKPALEKSKSLAKDKTDTWLLGNQDK